jgi:hypothetical protein
MRAAGMSFREISENLGVPPTAMQKNKKPNPIEKSHTGYSRKTTGEQDE